MEKLFSQIKASYNTYKEKGCAEIEHTGSHIRRSFGRMKSRREIWRKPEKQNEGDKGWEKKKVREKDRLRVGRNPIRHCGD